MKRNYQHSKWTSINEVKGWRHFEVINVNKKTNELELFSVCKKKIKVTVS
ncbi:MAG: TIGR02450 family Trp-rich protein, partial [Fidelibacterota bacterium]